MKLEETGEAGDSSRHGTEICLPIYSVVTWRNCCVSENSRPSESDRAREPHQNTQRNQDAVQPAIRVLSAMLHVALVLMIEKGSARTWTPVYPALGTPRHPWPSGPASTPR